MGQPIIEITESGLDTGVVGSCTGGLQPKGYTKFTCYVATATGTIAGLVMVVQTSPDDGVTWYDAIEATDDKHAAVPAGVTHYHFSFHKAVSTQFRLCVETASSVASTANIYVMGE